jgi:antitoxin HicB
LHWKYSGNFHEKLIKKIVIVYDMKLRILIEQGEDGIFVAECPTLPGCISQGKTRVEAMDNIRDAAKGYLESLKKHNEAIPPPIDEDLIEVNA